MATTVELIAGAVVRWPSAPGSPLGVVVEHDDLRIHVRFDGNDELRAFNARAGAVERVELAGMVRRVSTGSIGLVHAKATSAPPRWQVIFDGRLVTVAEADLRPHVLDDPRSRMLEGRLGSARKFSLAVTARRYEIEQLTNDLVSLGESTRRYQATPGLCRTSGDHELSASVSVVRRGWSRQDDRSRTDPQGAPGARRSGPLSRDRASEPPAAVAVRAEVEVQRDVLSD